MDFTAIVDKKLLDRDNCICCVVVSRLTDSGNKEPAVAALIECEGEHGLFVYSCLAVPASKASDIHLETAIPVNDDFRLTIASKAADSQASGALPIQISTLSGTLVLELPHGDPSQTLLTELKRTRQVFGQNKAFGVICDSTWIEKYTKQGTADMSNPFVNDIFDPLASGPKTPDKDGWPFSQILQSNVGQNCPVVKDTATMEHAASTEQLSMTDSGSYQGGLTVASDHPLRRSYDQSMENLGIAVNNDTITNSRDDLVRHVMKQREEEYTEPQSYRLFCGTWNTNGQAASTPIKAWLSPQDDEIPPDIYAIGFQELDLSKNAYIFTESPKEEEWYKRVKEALHHKGKYRKVKLIRLVGMMLIVFVREELHEHLTDIRWDQVGTGILGMMGNKGGVGVRFNFHDTAICFVNTHLAAHVEEYERRNQDFREISSRMGKNNKSQTEFSVTDHDMVFWIGDLNYRLDMGIERAKEMIDKRQLTDLMNYDQLCRQIQMKKVFLDYVEGRINFIPTYKYDTGTDNWDSSEKSRVPAWCDRILWRGHRIHQLTYRSHMTCRISDHKPVSAIFDIGVKVINKSQYRVVYEDIMKQLDRMENEYLPQVVLSTTDVQFSNVRFIEQQNQIVTVTNTGQGLVQFEFIKKPNDKMFCKPWLTVSPAKGIINVGEILELRMEVYVRSMTVGALNIGEDSIEDILVLHLESGKDLFITIGGNYIPSCFGSSLSTLVNMFNPIRNIQPSQVKQLARREELSSDRALDIPKELYWLIDHLYKYGMKQENLFQQPGRESEIQEIRDCLDQGTPQDIAGQIHSVAEAVLLFLEALPDPVIPYSAYGRCLDCYSNFNACKQVLLDIPVCHRNTFKYICAFLRELLKYSTQNNLDAKVITLLFSGLVLRRRARAGKEVSGAARKEEENKCCAFLYHFLVNPYDG